MSPPSPSASRAQIEHYFSRDSTLLTTSELEKSRVVAVKFVDFELHFLTGSGLFSRGEFDEGSQLLLNVMQRNGTSPSNAQVCDLGCGWGPVGTLWAKAHPTHTVFSLDVNPRAVQLTQINFKRNGVENAVAWCADGLSATRDEVFDVVACNPPIRAGNAVIDTLFEGTYRCLKPHGELWAVIRTAQGAKSWAKKIEARFGSCETIEMKGGFRILKAVKS